jgi:hypothetical protein
VKRVVLCAALVACALVAAVARAEPADTYRLDGALAAIARETLWQAGIEDSNITRGDVLPVSVRCYRDRESFEITFERRFRRSASRIVAYYAGGPVVHLRHGTCRSVRTFLRGRVTVLTAGAYAVLLHESLHRQGVTNERITTCFADEGVRWGMRWYGFSDAQALRGRNLAFTYTRLYAPPSYRMGRPNCLLLTSRKGWRAFTH